MPDLKGLLPTPPWKGLPIPRGWAKSSSGNPFQLEEAKKKFLVSQLEKISDTLWRLRGDTGLILYAARDLAKDYAEYPDLKRLAGELQDLYIKVETARMVADSIRKRATYQ